MRFLCRIWLHHIIGGESFHEFITANGIDYCRWRHFEHCIFCGMERIGSLRGDWQRCREDRACYSEWMRFLTDSPKPIPHVRKDAV